MRARATFILLLWEAATCAIVEQGYTCVKLQSVIQKILQTFTFKVYIFTNNLYFRSN